MATGTRYVHLDGKEYVVTTRADGDIWIHARWEAFDLANRHFANPPTVTRTRYVDPLGRLGRRVLAALPR